MSAQKFDFIRGECGDYPCEQGADFSYRIDWQVENPADSGTYTPINITNYTAKMQVKKDLNSPVVIELSTANGRISLVPLEGGIVLTISSTDTNTIPAGIYRYDLELTDSNGFVTRFIYGLFEVIGQVTV